MKLRELLNDIMPDIEKYVIKNGTSHIILPEYEYMREVITLYAKQHKLVKSTLTLVDMGNNEEAYILARSILNNYFLIGYLLNDDEDRNRLKKYQIQSYLSKRRHWKKVKQVMKGLKTRWNVTIDDADRIIAETEEYIVEKGFSVNTSLLSISDIAKNSDEKGMMLYAVYYMDASRYEHSDISTLEIYKQSISDDVSNKDVFTLNLNRTDDKLKKKIYEVIISSYIHPFIKIIDVIENKEPHLKQNYNSQKLHEILSKIIKFLEEDLDRRKKLNKHIK